jgi:CRP/FNR family cyclic AMP-dependent transcriptional regulator
MPSKTSGLVVIAGTLTSGRDGAPTGSLRWKEDLLATVPLFAGISKRHRRSIARIATLSRFDAGDTLLVEGGAGDVFGVIVDGTLRVVRSGRTVSRIGAGDFFGEVAVLDPGPRTASLIAQATGRWLRLNGRDLARLMSREPGVGAEIARVLARRLREASAPRIQIP